MATSFPWVEGYVTTPTLTLRLFPFSRDVNTRAAFWSWNSRSHSGSILSKMDRTFFSVAWLATSRLCWGFFNSLNDQREFSCMGSTMHKLCYHSTLEGRTGVLLSKTPLVI